MIFYIVKVDGLITQKGYSTKPLTGDMEEVTQEEYYLVEIYTPE